MEADRADGADGAGSEYKVSEAVKTVRTCQNSLGQNGTHLGLLLLLVEPNGDGFGGQAFMEHYNGGSDRDGSGGGSNGKDGGNDRECSGRQ
jgi:hypothetical protein